MRVSQGILNIHLSNILKKNKDLYEKYFLGQVTLKIFLEDKVFGVVYMLKRQFKLELINTVFSLRLKK